MQLTKLAELTIIRIAPLLIILLFGNFTIPADTSKRPIKWQDVAEWKHIPGGSVTISGDGNWIAYWYSPNKGNSILILQSTVDDIRKTYDIGEIPGGFGFPGAIEFSNDSRFMAYIIYPLEEDKKDKNNSVSNSLGLIDLKNDKTTNFDKVRSFAFSGENSGWLAVHLSTPEPSKDKDAGKGTDLLLVELDSGNRLNLGNVSSWSFDKEGNWLAWLTDAYGNAGNGLQLRNMSTGVVISPENDKATYSSLNWTNEGDGLVMLKAVKTEKFENDIISVIAFRGLGKKNPEKIIYDPQEDQSFPGNMSISPNYQPRWSDDLKTLFFGIHLNQEKKQKTELLKAENDTIPSNDNETALNNTDKKNDDEKPDLILWHWQDSRLQSVQKNRESIDKNFSFLSLYHVSEKKFIQIADADLRTVNIAPKQKYGIGLVNSEYELLGSLSGQNFADVYIVDLKTGERKNVLEKHRIMGGMNPSPDGERFVFYSEGHYFACNFSSAEITPLTKDIPASFIDIERDQNIPFPPTPLIGWTSDSKEILVRDNWNIWKISHDGRKFENLTIDGIRNGIRYQNRFRLDPDEEGIDLKKPLFVRVFDESNKESGFARIDRNKKGATHLLNGAAVYNNLNKARNREVYFFTKETVISPPDYYVTGNHDLSGSRKITDNFPEQENYSLSPGSRLITYVSDMGDTLQAALFLPADYEEGKKYPTVVYIYERLTQGLNAYVRPVFPGGGFNRAMYTSNGYAVLMPDIVYKLNDPGMSAVWCVLPAVDAAIKTGIIDPENIAIHGHSWGGYQTSFLITQTDKFKAAVAGAPLTNMISMYSLIYWNTGGTNQPIFESSQGRLTSGYWDNKDAFERNSPVYFAKNVNTPLLLMHNDKDGAVDFTQGVEYYNTLRRLNKPVIMLQYEGENHGLRKTANQIDYAMRMMEFLDHHLKGQEAPVWIKEGIPLLEMQKHLENRPSVLNSKE
jgi:dipeptidyl aminopeptidase/acylaminoacyl peptidase